MTRTRRWAIVTAVALVVVAAPFLAAAWPAQEREDVSAAELLETVQGAADRGWSGFVETRGTLSLPSTDRFESVGALVGEETRMRVWWRDDDAWRVDRLSLTGETDLVLRGETLTEWSYERERATISRDPEIRLPRTSDMLPPELGARVLRGADPDTVTRLPARRVAGRSALGLRVVPPEASSVARADLWADSETGVPLLVEVYADGDAEGDPSFRTELRDFDDTRPGDDEVSFTVPPGVDTDFDDVLDIADAANQFAPFVPPATVAGLERRDSSDGAVGIYGGGLTELIVIPLRDQEAEPLREQLLRMAGNQQVDTGTVVAVGPLGVMLTGDDDGGWLISGSVTGSTLEEASRDVLTRTVFVEDDS